MRGPRSKNLAVLAVALVLSGLGIYNIVLKATWTLMDDGVYWSREPQGVVADRVAALGPAAAAGVRPGDVLLALNGQEVFEPSQVEDLLVARVPGARVTYTLLRLEERRSLEVAVKPLPQGNVHLFYYQSLVGFFSLVVGTFVMLRRAPDRAALHFYAICLLFFLVYSTSFTGRLNLADWTLFWADHLAVLFLPVAFLHFCLTFPERRLSRRRAWVIPAAYLPALALAGAAVASQALFVTTSTGEALWNVSTAIDRWKPLYFAALFLVSFLVLVDSYRRARTLTVRKQMKWLVWGTGAGVLPFLVFYAVPFALGGETRLVMELAGYIPLALIPLSLAYAVVKHRLMDVELIFRRTLVYTLATALVIGISLLVLNLVEVALAGDLPHGGLVATVSALLVIALFTPLKSRIQDATDRILYRERLMSRKALLRLSQDLNADLDLGRVADRLLDGVAAALGVRAAAVFLPEADGSFVRYRSFRTDAAGVVPEREAPGSGASRIPPDGPILRRLSRGEPVLPVEAGLDGLAEMDGRGYGYYFPCRVRGEVIAVLGVGPKQDLEPLNSEELDLLQALAGQVGTALMNGRLYRSLRQQADELRSLKEYNENILESLDSGILVLDLEGRVARWNRALEGLYGMPRGAALGRPLDEIFPPSFLEALRGSLVLGREEELANIYKLHLATADGRGLMVNVSIAPFQGGGGERAGTILILDDVTSRIRLEEQLQHAEKMASVGLLAAGVAHEVNTPLAGISSYAQLLRERLDGSDPRASLLDKIEKQSFRAAKIINSLLNFSRSRGAGLEPMDVNKTVLDVLSLLEHQLEQARIKVRRELAPDLPPVRGNEDRIQQVFFNLILNARDAMPHGGWLTLASRFEDGTVLVEVRDTGDGIRREDLKRIYDPFFTTKGIGRGTGLGLAVSYGILQEHGGTIFVDSAPGQGTTFRVELPALAPAEAAAKGLA